MKFLNSLLYISRKRTRRGNKMVRYRNTWAEIDLEAIRYNTRTLKNLLPKERQVMGVIKADGYGHGSVEVAEALRESGVNHFMVAYLEEAIQLRKQRIQEPILVIGRIPPKYAQVAVDYDITLAIFQPEWLRAALATHFTGTLSLHLEFETGFNRTGLRSEADVKEIVELIHSAEGKFQITGAYTHFATADEVESSHYERQKKRYEAMLHVLETNYDQPIITHIGNSAAGIQYPEQMRQYTRFGISLYGLYPSKQIKQLNQVKLKEAFSLYSELIEVKQIQPGEYIGYGITYEATEAEWIGTVPIGYADGWPRKLQGFHVLVGGKKQPIVGRICMDMLMIKLDHPYAIGERVTLIGENADAYISVDDVADYLDTINYEVPCMITSRIPREYINK